VLHFLGYFMMRNIVQQKDMVEVGA